MMQKTSRVRRGMPMLLAFLLATLGLSLWLGLQAVGAARAHQSTAEGILRDYAEIALAEYRVRVRRQINEFYDEAFGSVPRMIDRGDDPPAPRVMGRRFAEVLRDVGCRRCSELRGQAVFLTLDMATGEVESRPYDYPLGEKTRAVALARSAWEAAPADRIALRTVGPGEGLEEPSILFFNASLDENDEEGRGRAISVILAPMSAVSELFASWYREDGLLPEAVSGNQPNDSLLHLAVTTADGHPVFLSPISDQDVILSRDSLPSIYGGLVLEVGIRTDAASTLVIGGLPRARLPLLLALMIMTVGVGIGALVQIRKEEELARVRDDFISGVSHEFRTPLTQIRMFTELLADGKLKTQEEQTRSTAVINREARRLTHLVENILHFSQMGRAPGPNGMSERIEVQDAISDLLEAFAPMVEARGVELEADVSPPDLRVRAGRSGLHRMLANLLDNALKYGPTGQTVRMRAVTHEGWVRISVEDEGPGIPAEERARVWDPYHRLERDVEGQVRGSGIGLSVVSELAQVAGGAAWVEEGKGKGACFVIRLPQGDLPADDEESIEVGQLES